ncbi:MAG TPA: hypothetical protein VK699_09055 [Terriglobales bacterium]|jgi:hypothetical protein|nr:hypothetical protein [Terriglobales bacterium]
MQSCERRRGTLSPSALFIAFAAVFLALPSNARGGKQQDSSASHSPAEDFHLPTSANDLVRQAIDNELKQTIGDEKYFYMVHKLSGSGEQIKEYVETDEGAVGRLVAMNGKPLPADQMRKEDMHLQKLATDPETKSKHRKEQLEDEERTTKMLQAMPDAFIFQYEGTEDSPQYGTLVRLQFKPNPNFDPPSRETQIYRGMEGTMLIDAAEKRLVKIDAHLTQEVTFGWGIFGHLDKGGAFVVEQSKISPRRWETTMLEIKFTGRVLLFKKLNIDEKELTGDFHPAPPHLSLEEGINVLKQQNPQLAQDRNSVPKATAK